MGFAFDRDAVDQAIKKLEGDPDVLHAERFEDNIRVVFRPGAVAGYDEAVSFLQPELAHLDVMRYSNMTGVGDERVEILVEMY